MKTDFGDLFICVGLFVIGISSRGIGSYLFLIASGWFGADFLRSLRK